MARVDDPNCQNWFFNWINSAGSNAQLKIQNDFFRKTPNGVFIWCRIGKIRPFSHMTLHFHPFRWSSLHPPSVHFDPRTSTFERSPIFELKWHFFWKCWCFIFEKSGLIIELNHSRPLWHIHGPLWPIVHQHGYQF